MTKPISYTDPANLAPLVAKAAEKDDYRALVCIFLAGGNDSHNMILPRATNVGRTTYDLERGTLAVTLGTELPLTTDWGLNPNMPNFKGMWDAGKAAVLMNVGFLKEPTDRAKYLAKRVRLPEQLYSHNTQQELWRGVPPYTGLILNGWMGRAHDFAGDVYNISPFDGIPSTFSIAGRNTQMQGFDSVSSDMSSTGPTTATTGDLQGLTGTNATNFTANIAKVRIYTEWGNELQDAMVSRVNDAILSQSSLAAQLQLLPTVPIAGQAVSAEGRFTAVASNTLAQQLKAVARIIHSRNNYTQRRHLFYVSLGGWDDHDNLITGYGPRLANLDVAIRAFADAMADIGMQNNVTVFTQSEFGRALKQNGNGSDHGWGGHALIFGGAVNGGQLYGTPPDLRNGSTNDAGQGRMIPTTSVEQYVGTMLKWWGIPEAQLPVVLENLPRFSPATLPILAEPAPLVVTQPSLRLSLANGQVPPQIDVDIVNQGPRTYFDKDGVMRVVRVNMIRNSAGVGGVIGTPNSLPTTWSRGIYAGLSHTLVGRGVDEEGDEYVDIRIHGTNTTGAVAYPHLVLSDILARGGWRFVARLKAAIIAGSTAGISIAPIFSVHTLTGSTYVGSVSSGISRGLTTTPGYRERTVAGAVPTTGVDTIRPVLEFTTSIGATVDITVRVGCPSLEWVLAPMQIDSRVGRPLRTTGAAIEPPRFAYDPATKRYLGLFGVTNSHNRVINGTHAGALIGTPGTAPPGNGGMGGPAGLLSSISSIGTEDGMPYMDIRIFGTPTATGDFSYVPMNAPAAATQNQDFVSFMYGRVVAGSMAQLSGATWETMGRTAGTATLSKTVSLMGMTKDRLVTQRFVAALRMTTAGIDGADCRIRLGVVSGQPIDLTIRLGAMQMTATRAPMPFFPTYGTVVSLSGKESFKVDGADFSSAYSPNGGTVSVRYTQDTDSTNVAFDEYTPVVSIVNAASGATDMMRLLTRALPSFGSSTDGQGSWKVEVGSVAVAEPVSGVRVPRLQTATRVATFAPNNIGFAQRGVKVTPDTANTIPASMAILHLGGNDGSPSGAIYYQEIALYNTRLTDDEAARISS